MRPLASSASARGLWVAVLILLLAAGARFDHLEDRTVWTDEGWTAWATLDRSPGEVMDILREDRHPPLVFLALAVWEDVAGESRLALRTLSALGGILTAAVVYRIGADHMSRAAGRYAALIYAALGIAVYYDQEIRHYGWLTLSVSLMALFFLRHLRHPRARWLAGLAVSTALMLVTNYFGLPTLGVQIAFGLLLWRWSAWRGAARQSALRDKLRLVGAWAAAALLCVPLMHSLFAEHLDELLHAADSIGVPFSLKPGWESFWTMLDLLLGHQPAMMLALFLLGAASLLYPPDWRSSSWLVRAYLVAAGGGLYLALFAASVHTPTLTARTLVFLTPMLALVCGYGLSRLSRPLGEGFAGVLAAAMLIFPATIQPRLAYDDAAAALAARYAPGDLVVLETGWDDHAFLYEVTRAVPDSAPTVIRTLPWVAHGQIENYRPVVPQISAELEARRRVWVVQWLQGSQVIPALDEGQYGYRRVWSAQIATGAEYRAAYPNDPTVQIVLFERPDLAGEPVAVFGAGQFALRDVIVPERVRAGAALPVDLWWAAPGPSDQDYSAGVYVLALDEDRVVAQVDGALGGLATSQWPGDPPLVDARVLALPGDLPSGVYRVAVGVYWFGDGVPLAVEGQPGAAFAVVGQVRVE